MDDVLFRWTGPSLVLIAGSILALAVRRRRRRRPAALCPGPRRHWLRRLSPWRWCWRSGCRYDLTGLVADGDGLLRCPECGRRLEPRRAIGTRYRWQAGPCGLLAFAIGCGIWLVPALRRKQWSAMVPTMALIVTERVYEKRPPLPLVSELDRRISNGAITGWTARRLAEAAVLDLRDDDIPRNGRRAMDILQGLGIDAVPALEAALDSSDWQQRQLAASLLRRNPGCTDSMSLIRVTIEGLRDDDLPTEVVGPGRRNVYTPVCNAREGAAYLRHVPVNIEPFLADAIRTGDRQQRFLCALVAVHRDRAALNDLAAPVLIEHLADNDIWSDAGKSRVALLAMGPAVLPILERHRDAADAQQRRIVRGLIRQLTALE